MPDLDAFMAGLAEARETAGYSVGWIDGMARGASRDVGILETAETAGADAVGAGAAGTKARAVPVDFPGFVLNPLSINLFNQVYYHRVPAQGRTRTLPVRQFFYPLDAITTGTGSTVSAASTSSSASSPMPRPPAGMRLLAAISDAGPVRSWR